MPSWWVYSPGHRLALPADMPRLELGAAIDRGWHMGARLLEPDPPVFLPTSPLPDPGYLRGYRVAFVRLKSP